MLAETQRRFQKVAIWKCRDRLAVFVVFE